MQDVTVEVSVEEGVSPPVDAGAVEAAVRTVLLREGIDAAELSVTFVGDAEISRLNLEYLSHQGPTDVISFPLSGPESAVVGDVYVGADQARRQADDLGVPLGEEMLRLAIHGTLHVLGYDHPEGEGREESEMYGRQEQLLALVMETGGRDG